MLEYENFRQRSTIANVSESIIQALERILNMAMMKENYVDYLTNRPYVERIGEHVLFTDVGKLVHCLIDIQPNIFAQDSIGLRCLARYQRDSILATWYNALKQQEL